MTPNSTTLLTQMKMFKTGRSCNTLSVGRFQELNEGAAKELTATFSWDAVQVQKQNHFQVRTMHIPHMHPPKSGSGLFL